jgi:hypothetical protein
MKSVSELMYPDLPAKDPQISLLDDLCHRHSLRLAKNDESSNSRDSRRDDIVLTGGTPSFNFKTATTQNISNISKSSLGSFFSIADVSRDYIPQSTISYTPVHRLP